MFSVALQSTERKNWPQATLEEFKTLLELGTWVGTEHVPSGAKVIS